MLTVILNKQKGIALVQVLIISIILTMLGIYIIQTVRMQVGMVRLMQKSFQVNLIAESVEAELLHTLLTNKRYLNKDSENPIVLNWNFYGKPFIYNTDTQIAIQDMTSLLSLNHLNKKLVSRLFEQLGYQEKDSRFFFDALLDWKDKDDLKRLNGAENDYYRSVNIKGPRNGYLQSMNEVLNIKNNNVLTKNQWSKFFSIALISEFNPLNAPEDILKVFINDDQAFSEVIKQREQGILSGFSFSQATGIDTDEGITFNTGRILKVKILTKKQNSQFSKNFIVDLRPNAPLRAITISNVTWENE